MTILARYTPKDIAVEVVEVYTTGNRKFAAIRALSGQPFTQYTQGGPADTDEAHVSADLLTDIHSDQPTRRSRQAGFSKPELTYCPLEDAPMMPTRYQAKRAGGWKGINSD